MARFRFTLEYEGTRYSGWQVQKNARTVQGELIGALATVLGTRDFEFMGSGRTDAGVHALHQVAHLEASTMLAPHIMRMKLNDILPADVNILDIAALTVIVEEAGGTFTDLDGGAIGLASTSVLATNGALHAPLLAALR